MCSATGIAPSAFIARIQFIWGSGDTSTGDIDGANGVGVGGDTDCDAGGGGDGSDDMSTGDVSVLTPMLLCNWSHSPQTYTLSSQSSSLVLSSVPSHSLPLCFTGFLP